MQLDVHTENEAQEPVGEWRELKASRDFNISAPSSLVGSFRGCVGLSSRR